MQLEWRLPFFSYICDSAISHCRCGRDNPSENYWKAKWTHFDHSFPFLNKVGQPASLVATPIIVVNAGIRPKSESNEFHLPETYGFCSRPLPE